MDGHRVKNYSIPWYTKQDLYIYMLLGLVAFVGAAAQASELRSGQGAEEASRARAPAAHAGRSSRAGAPTPAHAKERKTKLSWRAQTQ